MNRIKMIVNKINNKINEKIKKKDKRPKDLFDVSLRDLGRASRRLVKRVIVKSIKEW